MIAASLRAGVACRVIRSAAVVGTVALLAACGPQSNPQTFLDNFGPDANANADMALAALARGDYGKAEQSMEASLKRDPHNVYALLAGGLLYQNTNRPAKARTMYEALLSLRPTQTATVGNWDQMQARPIVDIAAENLRRIDAGMQAAGLPTTPVYPAVATFAPVAPAAMTRVASAAPDAGGFQALDDRTRARADRFLLLRKLRDDQLISPEEYNIRRAANVGALLPLTQKPPAQGLDRPPPPAAQVEDRLKALQQALQSRAISDREQALERDTILDALMPAKPTALAPSEAPPSDAMAAADRLRQIERLRTMGLITDAEAKAEQNAVEAAQRRATNSGYMGVTTLPPETSGGGPKMLVPEGGAETVPLADQVSVHLSSYRSMALAQSGWNDLKKRYRAELGGLQPNIHKVKVPGKGDYYRLYAGPLGSRTKADAVCRELRRKKQFCSVVAE